MTDFRDALDTLAEGRVPPADQADRALRGATRRRRRNRILTVTGAAVLVVAVAAPIALLRGHHPSAPTANGGNNAGADGYAIVSYFAYTDETANPGRAWDPAAHRYIHTGYSLIPSPDGQWAYVADDHGQRWAIARWADALAHRNLSWHLYGDPVEDPGGPDYQQAVVTWASEGATLVEVLPKTHATTYLDPATMRGPTVPWPADLTRPGTYVAAVGTYADQVTYRVYRAHQAGTTVYSVNRQGVITRTARFLEFENYYLDGKFPGALETGDVLSPDGRYILPGGGTEVLDTQTGRRVAYTGPELPGSGFDQPIFAGWYGNDHIMRVLPGNEPGKPAKPVVLAIYDVHGQLVRSVPLPPALGPGRTGLRLLPAGPATDGTIVIHI